MARVDAEGASCIPPLDACGSHDFPKDNRFFCTIAAGKGPIACKYGYSDSYLLFISRSHTATRVRLSASQSSHVHILAPKSTLYPLSQCKAYTTNTCYPYHPLHCDASYYNVILSTFPTHPSPSFSSSLDPTLPLRREFFGVVFLPLDS